MVHDCNSWTPISEHVIQRLDEISTKKKQTETTKGYPIFDWSPGITIMYQSYSKPENEESYFHRNEENDDMTEYCEEE